MDRLRIILYPIGMCADYFFRMGDTGSKQNNEIQNRKG
ncbi:MAG: hypothetical protein QG564_260 [Campylobacterota bacterium]|nr:hypothetical protein [Campylobacterota bacterium]